MAELILAAVALGLAGPGIAVSFAQCGSYLKGRVDRFNQAPATVNKVGSLGHQLNSALFKENLDLAAWAYSRDDIDISLKAIVEDQIERLRSGLIAADKILDRCFDGRGNLNRGYFFFGGEKNLKASIKDLEEWQQTFWSTISLIEMKRRIMPDPLLLTPSKLKTYISMDGKYCAPLETGSHILLAQGQLNDGTVREVSLIVEQKRKISTGLVEVKEIASCLSREPTSTSAPRGILKCLGYREEPNLELIFEVPACSGRPQTLARIISEDSGHGYGGGRPLEHRFYLSNQISEAVLSVHTCSRVHKNIRPDAILMVQSPHNGGSGFINPDFGVPYLTDWTMLRKMDTPSSMVGEHDWQKDMYRHPKRHGLQPEQRYNMGHDIYSLGVCLLEIGLWEPLITRSSVTVLPSTLYQQIAVQLGILSQNDIQNITTLTAQSDVETNVVAQAIKALTRPVVMQRTLVALAVRHLPSHMGTNFAQIVVACLQCLESKSDFGAVSLFETNNKTAVGVKFREMILLPLAKMSLQS